SGLRILGDAALGRETKARGARPRGSHRQEGARRPMNVLAINCGSSSIKFGLFDEPAPADRAGVGQARDARRLAHGRIERLGTDQAQLAFEADRGAPLHTSRAVRDHTEGVRRIAEWLGATGLGVQAVGHRVVHGGPKFRAPTVLDASVVAAVHELEALAPLHNGPSLAGIEACRAAFGSALPMVAVFDTAFHAALPERAWRYAIPRELADRHGIRRFGFHGISYRAVRARHCALTARPASAPTI